MRAGTVLLLLATVAWARDCPFCEEPMVRVPVHEAVHYFCGSCSCTVYANPSGPATASVRVRGGRRTFLLLDKDTVSRRHWDIVAVEDLEPDTTEGREGGRIWAGHPVSRPGHPVTRPGHPVGRPRHPIGLPSHAVKRPAHSVKRPSHPVTRPAHAVKRPAHAVKRPSHAVRRPAHAVKRPSHPVTRPAHAIRRPGHPVTRPGRILTSAPQLAPPEADGPALLLAPRKWSPPPRRAAARRYGSH
ncbi:MAG: hypothetical protein ACYTDU_15410 [Planctomycetota bacterium]|jgi:hypothetical protein